MDLFWPLGGSETRWKQWHFTLLNHYGKQLPFYTFSRQSNISIDCELLLNLLMNVSPILTFLLAIFGPPPIPGGNNSSINNSSVACHVFTTQSLILSVCIRPLQAPNCNGFIRVISLYTVPFCCWKCDERGKFALQAQQQQQTKTGSKAH